MSITISHSLPPVTLSRPAPVSSRRPLSPEPEQPAELFSPSALESAPLRQPQPSPRTGAVQLAAARAVSQQTALKVAGAALGGVSSVAPGLWTKFKNLAGSVVNGEFFTRRKARQTVDAVNRLEPSVQTLSDSELKAKTSEFKARLKLGESVEELLPEAFAVVRESCHRTLGIRPYDVQVEGGFYAHRGGIVEMKTGEGKTFMGMLPIYLNSLTGEGVHVMTYNDYLAGRDAVKAEKVLGALGVRVACIHPEMGLEERREANKADVIYGSASEFGFQYLNDNLAMQPQERVGRDTSAAYALIDEADSLLLDEARTPLIISESEPSDERPTAVFAEVMKHLHEGVDFKVEEKDKNAWLTEMGLQKVEQILGVGDLYSGSNQQYLPYLDSALHVKAVLQRDVDYMIQDGRVLLVDELTGRAKEDHRFSEGVHQAIEAAEGLRIGASSRTLGSVTLPNFLRRYGKVAGMTGTALSAGEDFQSLGLSVIDVPTHKPDIRKDLPDRLFPSREARDRALAEAVVELQTQGRPVLLGTRSIEDSERLSQRLDQLGISHQVLNARNPQQEAAIVAQAGRKGTVTIATNMAGRGTDIKLGGDAEGLAEAESVQTGQPTADLLSKWKAHCRQAKEEVEQLGGLAVLGAGRNVSRRIDDQLAGRAGRQGAPGSSQFFLSLDDDLFVRNLEERPALSQEVGGVVADSMVRKAQTRAEGRNRDARNQLMQYDQAVNLQRESVYADRAEVLDGENLNQHLPFLVGQAASAIADLHFEGSVARDTLRAREHAAVLTRTPLQEVPEFSKPGQLDNWLQGKFQERLCERREAFGEEAFGKTLSILYLGTVDQAWSNQQEALKSLREGSWMKAFAEKDPLQEYNLEAYQRFQKMLKGVAVNFVSMALQVPTPAEARAQIASGAAVSAGPA
ncbi:MAG: preprotein translocase subunit SecA [Vulcanimicrobiota bacterium]